MRKINFLIIFILLVFGVHIVLAQSSKTKQKEKIVGTVIAQYNMNAFLCVYHPCAVWLIVRLDQHKGKESSLAKVQVEYFPNDSLPNRGFPVKFVDKARKWKFSAVRDSSRDTAIEKYIKSVVSGTEEDITEKVATPAWSLLPGVENEKIPVGEILPYYFVKSGDYKEIRDRK